MKPIKLKCVSSRAKSYTVDYIHKGWIDDNGNVLVKYGRAKIQLDKNLVMDTCCGAVAKFEIVEK